MSTSLYFCIRPCAMWKRSRNSHFLSQQLDHDPSGDLNLPPPKKKMPKHKRKFTKTIDKRAKKAVPATKSNGSSVDPQVSTSVESSASASVQRAVSTRGAKRKVPKFVLESNLKYTYKNLDNAQSSLADQDKTIESLSKRNLELTDVVKSNREAMRQTKNVASITDKQVKGQMKETQAAASTSMKLAKAQVKKSQAVVKNLQVSVGERDSVIMNLKKQHGLKL